MRSFARWTGSRALLNLANGREGRHVKRYPVQRLATGRSISCDDLRAVTPRKAAAPSLPTAARRAEMVRAERAKSFAGTYSFSAHKQDECIPQSSRA
jgi:hypothetical protein